MLTGSDISKVHVHKTIFDAKCVPDSIGESFGDAYFIHFLFHFATGREWYDQVGRKEKNKINMFT